MDIILSALGLILLIPIFVPVMIILRFTGEREVFYLQERMGLNNKVFYIYKFATMVKDSPNLGSKTVTLRNDPRVTRVGKILRLTKINELPQILNVLKGEMTLVGPRPLIVRSFYKYSSEVQKIIYKNKPGITGIGSLIFRDEEKLVSVYKEVYPEIDSMDYYKQYIYPYKGQLEQWYFNNVSFWVDLKILFLTFYSIVNSKNERVYKWFKSLPEKPDILTVEGIRKTANNN